MYRHTRPLLAVLALTACTTTAKPAVPPTSTTSTPPTTTTTTMPPTTTVPPTTSTTAAPAPRPVSASNTSCEYATRIHEVFGPAGDWATGIAWRESRCTSVQNSEGASGLFQLMLPLHSQLFIDTCGSVAWADPDCNIRTAYALYQRAGTAPWAL